MHLRFFSPMNEKHVLNDNISEIDKLKTSTTFFTNSTDSDNSSGTSGIISDAKIDDQKAENTSEITIQKFSSPKFQKLKKNNTQTIKKLTNMKSLHPIAKGSYGTVYKGIDLNDKIVAVKSIEFSENGIECLLEASIMSTIVHPYINIAHSTTLTDNTMNIVQTLADSDLHIYCRTNRIPKAELKRFLWQIAQAVYCLHKENIIHGDLKAQNVLVFGNIVKLCDFTLSIRHNLGDTYNVYTGTPTHRPVEVWMHKKWDMSSDIWSLGCTFYEIAKGKLLFPIQDQSEDIKKSNLDCIFDFADSTDQEINYKRYDTHYERHRPFIESGDLKDLLLNMLQLDPEKRLTISEVLSHRYFKDMPKQLNYVSRKNEVCIHDPTLIAYAQEFYAQYNAERNTINTAINLYRAVGEVGDYGIDLILLACLLISSKLNFRQKFHIQPNRILYECEKAICEKLEFKLHCELNL
jgi:cyclin-dependent kinase